MRSIWVPCRPTYPSPRSWRDGWCLRPVEKEDELARDLADFLTALQSIEPAEGPQPGVHNWFRGGSLSACDSDTRRALAELAGHVDVELVREIWADALTAPWDGVDRWFHGDIEGNLLLDDGRLAAVIDFRTGGRRDGS